MAVPLGRSPYHIPRNFLDDLRATAFGTWTILQFNRSGSNPCLGPQVRIF